MPTVHLSVQLGVRDDAWKRVLDGDGRFHREDDSEEDDLDGEEKEERDHWKRFTGTLWDMEYLSAGCIAGAKVRLSFALWMMTEGFSVDERGSDFALLWLSLALNVDAEHR